MGKFTLLKILSIYISSYVKCAFKKLNVLHNIGKFNDFFNEPNYLYLQCSDHYLLQFRKE